MDVTSDESVKTAIASILDRENFAQFLQTEQAPDPQLVVDTYLALADMPAGKRPSRTVVGFTWGVDEINAAKQPVGHVFTSGSFRHPPAF